MWCSRRIRVAMWLPLSFVLLPFAVSPAVAESEAAPEIQKRIMAQKMKDVLAAHLGGLKDTLSWQVLSENLFFTYQRLDE